MSTIPRLTYIGAYNYDSTIFNGLTLPEEADKSIFINSFLLEYGECRLLYPNIDFLKLAISNFSAKWQSNIERIFSAIEAEYNPLHNYDRHEEIDEDNTRTKTGTVTLDMDGDIETEYDSMTDERTVSAYNETTYQPDSKNVRDGTATDTYDRTDETTYNTEDGEVIDHDAHIYGNIGVTTSQTMLQAEIDLRKAENFYHIVGEMLYRETCLYYF